MMDAKSLFEKLKPCFDWNRIQKTLNVFNTLHRYTGCAQGEAAAAYILEQLKAYGVPHEAVKYRAYASLPLDGSELTVNGETIENLAVAFGGSCKDLKGELFYDALNDQSALSWQKQQERFSAMRGKIVLTQDSSQMVAVRAARAGAKTLIVMQKNSPREPIHHANVGAVWGTPQVDQEQYFPFLPMVTVTTETGEKLRAQIEAGCAEACLTVQMDNGIRETTMPIAHIRGADDSLVLISGHWDSWYEGITDNACSDAIMLEYARVLYEHRSDLGRSVKENS